MFFCKVSQVYIIIYFGRNNVHNPEFQEAIELLLYAHKVSNIIYLRNYFKLRKKLNIFLNYKSVSKAGIHFGLNQALMILEKNFLLLLHSLQYSLWIRFTKRNTNKLFA